MSHRDGDVPRILTGPRPGTPAQLWEIHGLPITARHLLHCTHYSATQHSTAQHSTAQHSTQHRTAPTSAPPGLGICSLISTVSTAFCDRLCAFGIQGPKWMCMWRSMWRRGKTCMGATYSQLGMHLEYHHRSRAPGDAFWDGASSGNKPGLPIHPHNRRAGPKSDVHFASWKPRC